MQKDEAGHSFRIQLGVKGCDLSAGEIADMEQALFSLRRLVLDFPVSILHISVVRHDRHNDYHVKTSLTLPGKTLFTGDRDVMIHPAYERCIHKLVKKVKAYKQRMQGEAELMKQAAGTHHTLSPTQNLELQRLEAAIAADDYTAFRSAIDLFDDSLTDRIGRWIQRNPKIESQLGDTITISDIVEDVFLNAFDQFPHRSHDVPPGIWLEGLIGSSMQALIQSPNEELANIGFARAARERGQ